MVFVEQSGRATRRHQPAPPLHPVWSEREAADLAEFRYGILSRVESRRCRFAHEPVASFPAARQKGGQEIGKARQLACSRNRDCIPSDSAIPFGMGKPHGCEKREGCRPTRYG